MQDAASSMSSLSLSQTQLGVNRFDFHTVSAAASDIEPFDKGLQRFSSKLSDTDSGVFSHRSSTCSSSDHLEDSMEKLCIDMYPDGENSLDGESTTQGAVKSEVVGRFECELDISSLNINDDHGERAYSFDQTGTVSPPKNAASSGAEYVLEDVFDRLLQEENSCDDGELSEHGAGTKRPKKHDPESNKTEDHPKTKLTRQTIPASHDGNNRNIAVRDYITPALNCPYGSPPGLANPPYLMQHFLVHTAPSQRCMTSTYPGTSGATLTRSPFSDQGSPSQQVPSNWSSSVLELPSDDVETDEAPNFEKQLQMIMKDLMSTSPDHGLFETIGPPLTNQQQIVKSPSTCRSPPVNGPPWNRSQSISSATEMMGRNSLHRAGSGLSNHQGHVHTTGPPFFTTAPTVSGQRLRQPSGELRSSEPSPCNGQAPRRVAGPPHPHNTSSDWMCMESSPETLTTSPVRLNHLGLCSSFGDSCSSISSSDSEKGSTALSRILPSPNCNMINTRTSSTSSSDYTSPLSNSSVSSSHSVESQTVRIPQTPGPGPQDSSTSASSTPSYPLALTPISRETDFSRSTASDRSSSNNTINTMTSGNIFSPVGGLTSSDLQRQDLTMYLLQHLMIPQPPTFVHPVHMVGRTRGDEMSVAVEDLEDVEDVSSDEETDICFNDRPLRPEVLNDMYDSNGVWKVDEHGDTFPHALSGSDNEDIAEINLMNISRGLKFEVAINAYNKEKETPLYCAVFMKKEKLVKAFGKLGANVNLECHLHDKAHMPIHYAVETSNLSMVQTLLTAFPSLDINARRASDKLTALMVALSQHQIAAVKQLGNTTFLIIEKIIDHIVKHNDNNGFKLADPRSGKTPLMMAVETKDLRVVSLFLSQNIDVDQVRQLVNMQNKAGNSALHLAAGLRGVMENVQGQMLRILIMAGGDTNKKNIEGETAKDWARNIIDHVAKIK